MITPQYCCVMARYNRWMNERLYGVCAELPDADRKQDRRAPFRSIHGTLNHLLLTDRLWMGRFTANPVPPPQSLADELYAEFAPLREARAELDARIEAWAATLTEEQLAADLTVTLVSRPGAMTMPLWFAVTHFFNHQAHHRGQLTTLLEQAGCDFGVTDLPAMPGGAIP